MASESGFLIVLCCVLNISSSLQVRTSHEVRVYDPEVNRPEKLRLGWELIWRR